MVPILVAAVVTRPKTKLFEKKVRCLCIVIFVRLKYVRPRMTCIHVDLRFNAVMKGAFGIKHSFCDSGKEGGTTTAPAQGQKACGGFRPQRERERERERPLNYSISS